MLLLNEGQQSYDAVLQAQTSLGRVNSRKITAYVELAGSLVIAFLFLNSSLVHLGNPYRFLASVYDYQIVGASPGVALATVLPFLELILSVCLIGRLFVGGALLASCLTLSMFWYAQMNVLWRGLVISCGCFDVGRSSAVNSESFIFTSGLVSISIISFVCFAHNRKSPKS